MLWAVSRLRCLFLCLLMLSIACGARSAIDSLASTAGGLPSIDGSAAAGGAYLAGGSQATGVRIGTGGGTSIDAGVTAISAGWSHTCALVNGGVWCWGDNSEG